MNGAHPTAAIVCPPWNAKDRRFRARHYAAWPRPCRGCGRELAISRLQKEQADREGLQFICEQCHLVEQAKQNSPPDSPRPS